ncbi:hypothetical protein GGQ91_002521 [Methylobacterium fujisawaense]|uniref:Uncharacterized protein n=1 Tax=Methylobacterium fujisawaense TaxID=107400 RepID=A0ABR6DAL6_9HYPH|nr:hypothetical protein [Methylobacterium fujisawaense]MBA9063133.1 hypothetical protein [Methylobacterium fujisawaense]
MKISFGAWAPDVASNDASVAAVARNVFPRPDGYGPVPAPNPVTQPLPEECRGSIAVQAPDGSWVAFAGTTTKLYRLSPVTNAWDDVTGSTPYLVPEGDYWSFALYGTRLFAVHLGAVPQVIDIATGTKFADLVAADPANPPPKARFVTVVSEFLFLGSLLSDPTAIQWSGIGDPTFWTPGVQDSDVQIFPDGGHVTGLVGGESLLVFQDRAIQQMVFAPGSSAVFQRSKLEDDRGAVAPWSVVKIGPTIFFLDRDGVYAFAAGTSVPIGKNRVNGWIQALRDPTFAHTAVAVGDPTGSRVLFAMKSTRVSDPTLLDLVLVYDSVQDRWTQLDLVLRHWLRAETAPVSIDSINEDIDAGTSPYNFAGGLSLDSALFSGGVPLIGVWGTDNRLALLEGPSMEALIATPDAMLSRPRRTYARGVRVDTDADAWFAQVGTRESLGVSVPVRFRAESPPNRERIACCHASGRYHRVQVRIPAGDAWTYATAIEPDAVPEGSA